jgi:hypothetical protein
LAQHFHPLFAFCDGQLPFDHNRLAVCMSPLAFRQVSLGDVNLFAKFRREVLAGRLVAVGLIDLATQLCDTLVRDTMFELKLMAITRRAIEVGTR